MPFEHDGMRLSISLSGSSGTDGVFADETATLAISVNPPDASNAVSAHYTVNSGPVETVRARWVRTDPWRDTQEFELTIGPFREGDSVAVTAVCRCAGRQVPDEANLWADAISFEVGAASPIVEPRGLETPAASRLSSAPPRATVLAPYVVRLEGSVPVGGPGLGDGPALGGGPSPGDGPPPGGGPRPGGGGGTRRYSVSGTVSSPDRPAAAGLRVQLVDRNIGGDVPLVATSTDELGRYSANFSVSSDGGAPSKPQLDLEARAFAGATFLAASATRYNASGDESLDIVLPAGAQGLPSEHETLVRTLGSLYGGRLSDLQETDTRADITYLANKSGWDARAVALAALADQFSRAAAAAAPATPTIHPAFFYALFRAGLGANPDSLYQASPQVLEGVWRRAIGSGVIPASLQPQVPTALNAFQKLSAARALDSRPFIGGSTIREMLILSLGGDRTRQQQFTDLWASHQKDPTGFWGSVETTFGKDIGTRLQFDGQLGFLTLNNATLMGRLHEAEKATPLSSMLDLVRRGYHRPEKWARLTDGAVPDQIPGGTPDEKRANYVDLMVSQLRLSYPTAVVAEMVGSGQLPLPGPLDLRTSVQGFLNDHQAHFEIGFQPVGQYLARNGLSDQVPAAIRQSVERIQRVYQITPTDQAMAALLGHNVASAYEVVRYTEDEFVNSFKDQLGGEPVARQTHARSRQVHNAVVNIASSYLMARLAPSLGSDPAAMILAPGPNGIYGGPGALAASTADVIAYPTLEGLFGSMDFCACEHCHSVLSPAAYLVDLLLFLDRPVNGLENPQAVLLERRPDLQYLPLNCENTNTALPYIDVVNETLEYFVANKLSLAAYTGHDTGAATDPAELMASPQFVNDAAYDVLKAGLFPLPLPFHRPLEMVRRYFERFKVPLSTGMQLMRGSDAVEAPVGGYGWRDILMEALRLSRPEHDLLINRTYTLQQLYGYPATTPLADVRSQLSNVKKFSRRMGITYQDAADLLSTRFINPNSVLIPLVQRLGVSYSDLKALKDGTISDAAFDALLPPGIDPAPYGGDIKAWVRAAPNYARIMGLITIANPTNSQDLCSFDALEFRYANPDTASNSLLNIDFVRLLRFIRLWKKLGWTISQTDAAITALYPAAMLGGGGSEDADLQRLDSGFLTFLPRLGVLRQLMERLHIDPGKDLASLLACWAPIGTNGARSLYAQMFLSQAAQNQDSAFIRDRDGNVLRDGTQKLVAHAETLRAAFSLTDQELSLLVTSLYFDATTQLNLDTISAIYRRAWLARRLKLSVRELLLLISWSGLDPFADLFGNPPTFQTVHFLDLVEALRATSLKPSQALYLIWNQDISGKSGPPLTEIEDLARRLRAAFSAIEGEFSIADDPTGQIARVRMALVYGAEATDFFFGLLANTLSVDVPYSHPQPTLDPAVVSAASGLIAYDDFRKRLSFSGVLTAATRDALKAVPGVTAPFQAAVDALYTVNQAAIGPFFVRYPELLPLLTAYLGSADPPEKKRTALLANFLPELKTRRQRQQALSATTAAAHTDTEFGVAILDDPAVLHRADNFFTKPALDDMTALQAAGLGAQFFWAALASGPVGLAVDAVPLLAFSDANPLPHGPVAGGPVSVILSGYLEAKEGGFYNIAVETDPTAVVHLVIDGQAVPVTQAAGVWTNQSPITLPTGSLTSVVLTVDQGLTKTLIVRWETSGRGWEVIPAQSLYSKSLVDRLGESYVRFLKAVSIAAGLKLTANEISYLASSADYRVAFDPWLNLLQVSGNPSGSFVMAALRKGLIELLAFARIKAAVAPADERLLTVIRDPNATLPSGDQLLLTLMSWESGSLTDLLAAFTMTRTDLTHVGALGRVYDAYRVLDALGVSAATFLSAARNDPTPASVRALQSALRARYQESDWLDVLRPINDAMRGEQRDALVAYVLQQLGDIPATSHIDTADKLFEYFLMDVEMDPCMLTSRVRHALSSIQLFIERCLMNLEPRVAPSSIKADQWTWMKRYRVWEAQKKLYLWPQDWLEPELRDDQSPFFKEVMSELLQSDITEDTAATALLNYLAKLEEVAKLEACGMCYEEGPGNAHLVARTAGAHRKYYYRRRNYGTWTPWEQIKVDIEDNPVAPVIWNDRLFLFWLRVLRQTPIDPAGMTTSAGATSSKLTDATLGNVQGDAQANASKNARIIVSAVLCWSEYYNGKWQAVKTSDPDHPTGLGLFPVGGTGAFDRTQLYLTFSERDFPDQGLTGCLEVWIGGSGSSRFLLYNTHSLPLRREDLPLEIPSFAQFGRGLQDVGTNFAITYWSWGWVWLNRNLLDDPTPSTTVEPRHALLDVWEAPFVFQDSRHVFYVTSKMQLVPMGSYPGYGFPAPANNPHKVPPVVWRHGITPEVNPKFDPLLTGTGPGVINPSPVEQFVAEDNNIRTGIAATGTVVFGGRQIGPAGSLVDGRAGPR